MVKAKPTYFRLPVSLRSRIVRKPAIRRRSVARESAKSVRLAQLCSGGSDAKQDATPTTQTNQRQDNHHTPTPQPGTSDSGAATARITRLAAAQSGQAEQLGRSSSACLRAAGALGQHRSTIRLFDPRADRAEARPPTCMCVCDTIRDAILTCARQPT